jgi:hypothetical protein
MAEDVKLLKTRGNSVLLLIQEAHLDPGEFQWESFTAWDGIEDYGSEFLMSLLIHEPTGFYYQPNLSDS